MMRVKKQTIQYVLVGVLIVGLAYLLMRKVQEGFASTVTKYVKAGQGADVTLMASEIPSGATKLTDIVITGYHKTNKTYSVNPIRARVANGVDTLVRFEIKRPNHPSQKIVKFYNTTSTRTPKLPINLADYKLNPTTDSIFVENLAFQNLQFSDNPSATLGTQFNLSTTGRTSDTIMDSAGKNLKVDFIFE